MYLLAKKSGRGEAVELYGHTVDEHVANGWNTASSTTLVFAIDSDEETEIANQPLIAMSKPSTPAPTRETKQDPYAAPSLDTK